MEIKELHKKKANTLSKEKCEELEKKARKESEKMVKGMFEFIDAQGGWLDFNYRIFKGDPILTLRLMHGETVELPMGIVKHLNNTKKKIRKWGGDSRGIDISNRGVPAEYETVSRVRFTPVEVM